MDKKGASPGAIREVLTISIRIIATIAGYFSLQVKGADRLRRRCLTLLVTGQRIPKTISEFPWCHRTSNFYCPVKAASTAIVNSTSKRNMGTNMGKKTARAARPLSISFATAVAFT